MNNAGINSTSSDADISSTGPNRQTPDREGPGDPGPPSDPRRMEPMQTPMPGEIEIPTPGPMTEEPEVSSSQITWPRDPNGNLRPQPMERSRRQEQSRRLEPALSTCSVAEAEGEPGDGLPREPGLARRLVRCGARQRASPPAPLPASGEGGAIR
jgi:hypothetical protein